jgi:hypothetical protein
MNPSATDRKLTWILPAAVSVVVVAAMLLFPYATGYTLSSEPLWRLLLMLWNASDEWKHGMFVFPIAVVLLFLKRTELAKVPIKGSSWGLLLIVPSLFLYWVGFVANVQYLGYLRHPIHARRLRYLVFGRALFQSRVLHLVFPVFRLSVHFFGRPRGVSAPALDE